VLSSFAAARRGLVLTLIGAVLIATVVVLLTWLNRSPRAVRPAAQDVAGPVLLVPGYGGSVASLQPLAESLRAAGKDVAIVALPGMRWVISMSRRLRWARR
jgi:triacylglycerol lipase